MQGKAKDVYRFSDGDVYCWIEQDSSIHLKSISAFGDPVELTAGEAKRIGEKLLELSLTLESL